jgi:hypothetical protein
MPALSLTGGIILKEWVISREIVFSAKSFLDLTKHVKYL